MQVEINDCQWIAIRAASSMSKLTPDEFIREALATAIKGTLPKPDCIGSSCQDFDSCKFASITNALNGLPPCDCKMKG